LLVLAYNCALPHVVYLSCDGWIHITAVMAITQRCNCCSHWRLLTVGVESSGCFNERGWFCYCCQAVSSIRVLVVVIVVIDDVDGSYIRGLKCTACHSTW